MQFVQSRLSGVYIIVPERSRDLRGFFARTLCADEFGAAGLSFDFVQHSVSYNTVKGTLRGMHYQKDPHAEVKLVRCTAGAVFDAVVDLRKSSSTYLQWEGFRLSAENRHSLYVPKGFAHGFITLEDDTEVFYQISCRYVPEAAVGLRFDDPVLSIEWPLTPKVISERDSQYPYLAELSD